MLSGVSILCLIGSYLVAFVLELFRFFFPSRFRHVFLTLTVLLGLVAHSAFLYHHQISLESGKIVSSVQGFFLIAAWGLACVYLFLCCFYPRIPFGLYLIPVILGLIFGGHYWASSVPYSSESVGQIWRTVHGLSILLATLAVFVGFIAGLMFWEQQHRLKKKITPDSVIQWPSLEWTQTALRHGIGFATVLLAVGIFSGLLLNHLISIHEQRTVSLTDPLVVGVSVLFLFLFAFLGTLTVYRPFQEGRRIAALTSWCFLFLVSILLFALFYGGAHWNK
ncbi:MAG: hypothetical protein FWC43_06370 [Planctomycetaceae bacterium]|nr:hypothetical protein [Planctomycetaceae bacterium]